MGVRLGSVVSGVVRWIGGWLAWAVLVWIDGWEWHGCKVGTKRLLRIE